jgi:hypothetical protein
LGFIYYNYSNKKNWQYLCPSYSLETDSIKLIQFCRQAKSPVRTPALLKRTKRSRRKRKSRRRGKERRRKSAIEKELPVAAAVARKLSRLVGTRGKRKPRRSIVGEREVVLAAGAAAAAAVVAAPVHLHLLAGKREGKPEIC